MGGTPGDRPLLFVIAGLDTAIHGGVTMDARVKPGHDKKKGS
jgi:hypothetical protein